MLLIRLCMTVRVLQALELKQWCPLTKCLPPEHLPVVRSPGVAFPAKSHMRATGLTIIGFGCSIVTVGAVDDGEVGQSAMSECPDPADMPGGQGHQHFGEYPQRECR